MTSSRVITIRVSVDKEDELRNCHDVHEILNLKDSEKLLHPWCECWLRSVIGNRLSRSASRMRFDDERANSLVGELIRCGNFIENKRHYTLDDIASKGPRN